MITVSFLTKVIFFVGTEKNAIKIRRIVSDVITWMSG